MALTASTITVTLKGGSLRKTGRAVLDLADAGATLVAATVITDATDRLKGSSTTARARVDAGVITVDVDAPLTAAGTADVLITTDS